jgi:hypothetical protein
VGQQLQNSGGAVVFHSLTVPHYGHSPFRKHPGFQSRDASTRDSVSKNGMHVFLGYAASLDQRPAREPYVAQTVLTKVAQDPATPSDQDLCATWRVGTEIWYHSRDLEDVGPSATAAYGIEHACYLTHMLVWAYVASANSPSRTHEAWGVSDKRLHVDQENARRCGRFRSR